MRTEMCPSCQRLTGFSRSTFHVLLLGGVLLLITGILITISGGKPQAGVAAVSIWLIVWAVLSYFLRQYCYVCGTQLVPPWYRGWPGSAIVIFIFLMLLFYGGKAKADDPREPAIRTYRDSQGNLLGTSNRLGNTTYYRDRKGNLMYQQSPDHIGGSNYRDGRGRYLGSVTIMGGMAYYRDAQGNLLGVERIK